MTRNVLLIVALAAGGCTEDRSPQVTPSSAAGGQSAEEDDRRVEAPPVADVFGESVLDDSRGHPFANAESKVVVLTFVSTECPIANRYAPELQRLFQKFQPQGVSFWLVYADNDQTADAIRQHVADYQLPVPALRDPEHRLVKFCSASRTPEAVVFAPGCRQVYRGRIDDRFTDYGKSREAATRHDLEEAIAAALAGKEVAEPITAVIGCHIPGVID